MIIPYYDVVPTTTLRCDCGGKLKRKLLRRELVGIECARCGRYVAKPEAAPEDAA